MGKKGNPNKPNNQPSFFKVQEQKLGIGFMNKMTTEFIQKNALKVFKDLAGGAINVEKEYQFFQIYDFTYNLMIAANNNARYNYYSYLGLANSPIYQQDVHMQRVATQHYENYLVFNKIELHLNNILKDITYQNGVYTRFYIQQLVADIRNCSGSFNGYFITLSDRDNNRRVKSERRQLPNDKGFSNQDQGGFFGKHTQSDM